MRLVYSDGKTPVKVGNEVRISSEICIVTQIQKPRHSGSTGRVYTRPMDAPENYVDDSYFPSVIEAQWIEREDREEPRPIATLGRYGFRVGDYVTTVIEMSDEAGTIVPKGTVVRIEAISPKVRICKGDPLFHDNKQYFLNSCQLGDKYLRLRHEFVTIRVATKPELREALKHIEGLFIAIRPRA